MEGDGGGGEKIMCDLVSTLFCYAFLIAVGTEDSSVHRPPQTTNANVQRGGNKRKKPAKAGTAGKRQRKKKVR